jgi:hypothetical protein
VSVQKVDSSDDAEIGGDPAVVGGEEWHLKRPERDVPDGQITGITSMANPSDSHQYGRAANSVFSRTSDLSQSLDSP